MSSMTSATDIVQRWVDAANRSDRSAIRALYAPDAVVVDNGRSFDGVDAIEAWSDRELIGVGAQVTAEAIDAADGTTDVVTLRSQVRSHGFNGSAVVRFTIQDGRIVRVEI